jgi:hypothetical protein
MGPLCAGLMVLAACSSGSKPGGSATVPAAAATAASTTTADPWAVPSTITPAYLDRVLAELNHIDGEAFRDARAHNAVTPTFTALEQAVRAGAHELDFQTTEVQQEIAIGWKGIRDVPGDRKMTVTIILPANSPCELSAVSVDFSAVTSGQPLSYPPWYVALVPAAPSSDNPTHWALADDGFVQGGGRPVATQACATS